MRDQFTFYTDTSTILFNVNPAYMTFEPLNRGAIKSIDGETRSFYMHTTEIFGELIWEAIPLNRTDWVHDITSLVGKSGRLETNKFNQFLGMKNILLYSQITPDVIDTGEWTLACGGGLHVDGTTVGPDGVSLAYLYKCDQVSGYPGCIRTKTTSYNYQFKPHNVLSVYVKEGNAGVFGINMYNSTDTQSIYAYWSWDSGVPVMDHMTSSFIDDYGIEYIRDGWYRAWIYHDAGLHDNIDKNLTLYLYGNYDYTAGFEKGTYFQDVQLEQGVTSPTPYIMTDGTAISEPLTLEFTDCQIEQLNTPGTVKQRITLNFKYTGVFL